MNRFAATALALLFLPLGLPADQLHTVSHSPAFAMDAPAPWSQQDPADSLYRAARDAMNRGDYDRAASLFHQVWDRHPRSSYAPDAPYWEAFSRYRTGSTSELERALSLLRLQAENYPDAATRRNGDAASLEGRVRGLLARRGNVEAAEALAAAASEVAGVGARISVEVAGQMEQVAREMAARGEMLGEHLAAIAEHGAAMGAVIGRVSIDDVPEECREEVEMQMAAMNALMHMKADRALPVLERVMERRDACSPPLRRQAVFLIADKHAPRSVDILLRAARADPDVEVRRRAVFWLADVDDPRAVEALSRFLQESDDERIRERAIFALAQHRSPEARRLLRQVAGDDRTQHSLRAMAIFWLGNEGTAEDREYLKELFGRAEDSELRERILFGVGQAESAANADWLLSVASDDGVAPRHRRTAIFWAAQSGAPATQLGQLYDRLEDRELKERIIFGLSQSDDPAAIDRLIRIVRSETDPQLRQKAIFWLGHSSDPRAAEVLMEVLSGGDAGG